MELDPGDSHLLARHLAKMMQLITRISIKTYKEYKIPSMCLSESFPIPQPSEKAGALRHHASHQQTHRHLHPDSPHHQRTRKPPNSPIPLPATHKPHSQQRQLRQQLQIPLLERPQLEHRRLLQHRAPTLHRRSAHPSRYPV